MHIYTAIHMQNNVLAERLVNERCFCVNYAMKKKHEKLKTWVEQACDYSNYILRSTARSCFPNVFFLKIQKHATQWTILHENWVPRGVSWQILTLI